MTLQHIIIHHHTKFNYKRLNHILTTALTVTFTLKTAKIFFFLHDTPAHNNTPPYQAWLQKVEWFWRDLLDIHWQFKPSLWPWHCTQQFNCSKDAPAYNDVPSNKVWCETDHKYRRYSKKQSYSDYISPCCDLNLEDSKTIFFLLDTISSASTPPYQFWLQKAEWYKRYCSDKIQTPNRWTGGQWFQ